MTLRGFRALADRDRPPVNRRLSRRTRVGAMLRGSCCCVVALLGCLVNAQAASAPGWRTEPIHLRSYRFAALLGVSCTSKRACFAVGVAQDVLIVRRTRGSWSQAALPPSPGPPSTLDSVSCPSARAWRSSRRRGRGRGDRHGDGLERVKVVIPIAASSRGLRGQFGCRVVLVEVVLHRGR